jgi:hypothetical protein
MCIVAFTEATVYLLFLLTFYRYAHWALRNIPLAQSSSKSGHHSGRRVRRRHAVHVGRVVHMRTSWRCRHWRVPTPSKRTFIFSIKCAAGYNRHLPGPAVDIDRAYGTAASPDSARHRRTAVTDRLVVGHDRLFLAKRRLSAGLVPVHMHIHVGIIVLDIIPTVGRRSMHAHVSCTTSTRHQSTLFSRRGVVEQFCQVSEHTGEGYNCTFAVNSTQRPLGIPSDRWASVWQRAYVCHPTVCPHGVIISSSGPVH